MEPLTVDTIVPSDFAVVRTAGWVAYAIRWFTRPNWWNPFRLAEWNHAVGYLGNGNIVEAQPGGVVVRSAREYKAIQWFHVDLTPAEAAQVVETWRKLERERYGFVNVAVIGLTALGLPDFGLRGAANTMFCSELIEAGYDSARRPIVTCKKPWRVTPQDLADAQQGVPVPLNR